MDPRPDIAPKTPVGSAPAVPAGPNWRDALRKRIANTKRRTWSVIAWLVIATVLYFPFDALSGQTQALNLQTLGVVGLVLAVFSAYVGKWLENFVHKLLYRAVNERVALVEQLVSEVRELSTSNRHFNHVARALDQIFGLDGTAVYVVNRDRFELVSTAPPAVPEWLDADEPLLLQIKREFRWKRRASALRSKLAAPVVWPIEHAGKLIGLLAAGPAVGEPPFEEDIEVEAVKPLCDLLAQAMQRSNPLEEKGKVFRECASTYASTVSRWFQQKFDVMSRFAELEELKTNNTVRIRKVLPDLVADLGPAFNGVYVLDETGLVIEHDAPPTVDIRNRYNASTRPYFRLCVEKMTPVVCDSLDTADRRDGNRPIEILVAAVPRLNRKQSFIGILDAVIDLPRAPFSAMATELRNAVVLPQRPRIVGIRMLLIDSAAIVLGTSDMHGRNWRASVGGHPTIEQLRRQLGTQRSASTESGAIFAVSDTPFYAVACESDDPADQPQP